MTHQLLIASDVHLDEDTADTVLRRVLPGLADAAVAHGVSDIALNGDIYELRYKVNVDLQNALRDWLIRVTGVTGRRVWFNPGNHDQVDLAGRNALEVFGDIPGVHVFTEPGANKWGFWVPYRRLGEDLRQAIPATPPPGCPPVLFLHHGLKGAWMNDNRRADEGVDPESMPAWRYVICGHYHKRQEIARTHGRAWYVGSPYQVSWHEAGQDKGYALWDPAAGELRYFNTDWGPRHHRVEAGPAGVDLSAVRPGDEVRVTAAAGVDLGGLSRALEATGAAFAVAPAAQVSQVDRMRVDATAGLRAYAMAYVDHAAPEGLDKDRLKAMFDSLAGGAP